MFGKGKKHTEEFALEEKYIEALRTKKVPLLTLDVRWHQLFQEHQKTRKLAGLEKELNKLIKKQGQTNQDIKEYEKARKVLMENMLNNMTDGQENDSPVRVKKQDANQKLMEELKGKIYDAEKQQEILPDEIKQVNRELLIETMRICYETLLENTAKIEYEDAWIARVREALTEHILEKQEMENRNSELYSYMHALFGPEILNIFDKHQTVWKGEIAASHKDES